MFQTEINHFLQSFASDGLTGFMSFITGLGYMEFLMGFLIFLLLAVHFKKGFLIFMVLSSTAVITFVLKDFFNLPRPFHVDNTLQYLDGELGDNATFDFAKRGATTFWGGLPADVLKITQNSEHVENGFPSGHSSIAIALWGAVAFLFRKRWVTTICLSLMFLIPLSRMYLGVHFLADVLGGIALGTIILGIFNTLLFNKEKLPAFIEKDKYTLGLNSSTLLLIVPPLLFLLILPTRIYILPAFMLGQGLGFLLLAQKGLPNSEGTLIHRIGRTVIGIATFVGVAFVLKLIADATGLADNTWFSFIRNTMSGLALIWIGTEISIKLGLFERNKIIV